MATGFQGLGSNPPKFRVSDLGFSRVSVGLWWLQSFRVSGLGVKA